MKKTHSFNFQNTNLSNALNLSAKMIADLNPETMSSVELQKFCKLLNAIDKVREDVVFLAGAESVMWQVNKKIENGELDVI
jgi:cellulose biosynthesis protein BcsQ